MELIHIPCATDKIPFDCVRDVAVCGDVLFLSTDADPEKMRLPWYDISDPLNMKKIGAFGWKSRINSRLRIYSPPGAAQFLYIWEWITIRKIDISDPRKPVLAGEYTIPEYQGTKCHGIHDLAVNPAGEIFVIMYTGNFDNPDMHILHIAETGAVSSLCFVKEIEDSSNRKHTKIAVLDNLVFTAGEESGLHIYKQKGEGLELVRHIQSHVPNGVILDFAFDKRFLIQIDPWVSMTGISDPENAETIGYAKPSGTGDICEKYVRNGNDLWLLSTNHNTQASRFALTVVELTESGPVIKQENGLKQKLLLPETGAEVGASGVMAGLVRKDKYLMVFTCAGNGVYEIKE